MVEFGINPGAPAHPVSKPAAERRYKAASVRFVVSVLALLVSCATTHSSRSLIGQAAEFCASNEAAAAFWKRELQLKSADSVNRSVQRCAIKRLSNPSQTRRSCRQLKKALPQDFQADKFEALVSEKNPVAIEMLSAFDDITLLTLRIQRRKAVIACTEEANAELEALQRRIRNVNPCEEIDRYVRIHHEHLDRMEDRGLMAQDEIDCRRASFPPALERACAEGSTAALQELSCACEQRDEGELPACPEG
jgi:hypothetical protein